MVPPIIGRRWFRGHHIRGFARLDWSISDGVGRRHFSNSAPRTPCVDLPPEKTREESWKPWIARLQQRGIAILLAACSPRPTWAVHETPASIRFFPDLAAKYALTFYPFFLGFGVTAIRTCQLTDGMHFRMPNGINTMVENFVLVWPSDYR